MNARDLAYYRNLRADGWRASYALQAVRTRAWVAEHDTDDDTPYMLATIRDSAAPYVAT